MTTITTYIAEDGTKFSSEEEREEYENEQRAKEFADTAFLYDEEGNPLSVAAENYENAYYIVAASDEAAEFMAEVFSGWVTPWDDLGAEAGCWVYDGHNWRSADEILGMAEIIKKIT